MGIIRFTEGKSDLPLKWIFKIKTKADGSVERYKAKLVVKGFKQEEGIDYQETFSPVIKKESLRAILGIAVQHQLQIHQLDVHTYFCMETYRRRSFMLSSQLDLLK